MFERFTDRSRRVVVLAQEEARMLNHNYIGTEHILLGLIREGDGVAAQVLVRLGADLNRVRQQVIQLLHGYSVQDVESAGSRPGGRVPADLPDDALARFDARRAHRLYVRMGCASERSPSAVPGPKEPTGNPITRCGSSPRPA
jgi:hypothetical protein